jgi:hypothetical protein
MMPLYALVRPHQITETPTMACNCGCEKWILYGDDGLARATHPLWQTPSDQIDPERTQKAMNKLYLECVNGPSELTEVNNRAIDEIMARAWQKLADALDREEQAASAPIDDKLAAAFALSDPNDHPLAERIQPYRPRPT